MKTPSRFLRTLDPPAGGWERLIRRRDGESGRSWRIPMAALTCAVAVLALALFWPHRSRVELKLNGARLVGGRGEGITLRMLDDRQAVALPSADPNVKLYWIDGKRAQGSG